MKRIIDNLIHVLNFSDKRKRELVEEAPYLATSKDLDDEVKSAWFEFGYMCGKYDACEYLLDNQYPHGIRNSILVIDDNRSVDYCLELNKLPSEADTFLATSADKAIEVFEMIKIFGGKFDCICLDHDLGDGKDIVYFLNYLIDNVNTDNHEIYKRIFSDVKWHIHTSNYSAIPNMISKIKMIMKGYEIQGEIFTHGEKSKIG